MVAHEMGGSGDRTGGPLRGFLALFGLGLVGVVALYLTMDTAQYEAIAETAGITVAVLLAVAAAQSLVLLGIAVVVGLFCAPRVGLRSHVRERVIDGTSLRRSVRGDVPAALGLGTLVGTLLIVATWIAPTPVEGQATVTLEALLDSVPMRLLYGGITEELLLRWGLLSLVAYVGWRLVGGRRGELTAGVAWAAIFVSSVAFGIGHLPAASVIYGALTLQVLTFIIGANTLAGLAFGWLYWRHSLEAAMIAHAFAHVVAVVGTSLLLIL